MDRPSRLLDIALALLAVAAIVNTIAVSTGTAERLWSGISNVATLLAIGTTLMYLREKRRS